MILELETGKAPEICVHFRCSPVSGRSASVFFYEVFPRFVSLCEKEGTFGIIQDFYLIKLMSWIKSITDRLKLKLFKRFVYDLLDI